MFQEKQFHWLDSIITYRKIGSGNDVMIAFHGYDQDSSVFEVFESSLGVQYTIISVDLPHQGNTVWKEDELTGRMMGELIEAFFRHLNIGGQVSLLAYSLGGNYALGLAYLNPSRVREIWLIACDGLKEKPAFNFITKTRFGRAMFSLFVADASLIKGLIKILGITGIVSKNVATFFLGSIQTKSQREQLYHRWINSSRVSQPPRKIIDLINQHHIHCLLLFGKNDLVIPISNARHFSSRLSRVYLMEVDQGHNLLLKKNNSIMWEMIQRLDNPVAKK